MAKKKKYVGAHINCWYCGTVKRSKGNKQSDKPLQVRRQDEADKGEG